VIDDGEGIHDVLIVRHETRMNSHRGVTQMIPSITQQAGDTTIGSNNCL